MADYSDAACHAIYSLQRALAMHSVCDIRAATASAAAILAAAAAINHRRATDLPTADMPAEPGRPPLGLRC